MTGSRTRRRRLRQWILVPQVALSLVTLVVAAVHGRALLRLETADRGYDTDGVTVIAVSRLVDRQLMSLVNARPAEWRKMVEDRRIDHGRLTAGILQRLESMPGASVGLTESLLIDGAPSMPTHVLAKTADGERHVEALVSAALGNFHDVMRIRVVRGRSFEPRDVTSAAPVAVVSEELARALFGRTDPIGRVLTRDIVHRVDTGHVRAIPKATWFEVIGVVDEVEPLVSYTQSHPRVYVSAMHASTGTGFPLVVVRSHGNAGALLRDAAAAIRSVDPRLDVTRVQPLAGIAAQLLFPRRMAVAVLITAGLAALVLACTGLFGVASYSAAERTREIGIRTTLGAGRRDVIALMLRDGVGVTVWGLAAGGVLGWIALRWSATVAPHAPTSDVVALIMVPLSLIVAVLVAAYLPARQAARIDPARVLRGE